MKRHFGDLVLDFEAHKFWRGADEVELTADQAAVLQHLIERAGTVVSRFDLLTALQRPHNVADSMTQVVSRMQRVLGDCITTVRGKGYRWDLRESTAASPSSSEAAAELQISTAPHAERLRLLEARLITAMTEPDVRRARRILENAVSDAMALLGGHYEEARCALAASTGYSELAKITTTVADRVKHRRAAIAVCKKVPASLKTPVLVARLADAVVDHFYDRNAREERTLMQAALAAAEQTVKAILSSEATSRHDRATLLAQLASIRGCKTLISPARDRERRAHDAIAPARRATYEAPEHPGAALALGQALHAWARYASAEVDYFDRMKQAEAELLRCLQDSSPLTWLVLGRFFRQSNRPSAALRFFERYERLDANRRRVLSESHVAGEAALLLWHQRPDADATRHSLRYSRDLLREAIDWGFDEARLFVCLASIEAAVGDTQGSRLTLARLRRSSADTSIQSWMEVIRDAQQAVAEGRHELLAEAFYLGLDDAMVWNALGTYVKRFAADLPFSTSCYETALLRDPENAYALTNLARNILDGGLPEGVAKARRHIETASLRADWSFVWWRPVAIRIEEILDERIEWPLRGRPGPGAVSFLDIGDRVDELADIRLPSDREAHWAEILYDLFRLSYIPVISEPARSDSRLQVRLNGALWTVLGVCAVEECHLGHIGPFLRSALSAISGLIVMSLVPVADDVTARAASPELRGRFVVLDERDLARILDSEQRIEEVLDNRIGWGRSRQ